MSRKLFILLLVAVLTAGLAVQAVADQYNFASLASTLITGRASSAVMGQTSNLVYELSGYGVTALDITDPANPVVLGRTYTPGLSYTGALSGNNLVIADGNSLTIMDVTSTENMNITGWTLLPGGCRSLAVSGNYAYCATEDAGLVVVDITTATIVASLVLPGSAYSVVTALDHAFVAMGSSGLAIVDVTNPLAPTLSGTADTPGMATGVGVKTDLNLAVLADGQPGVALVDITSLTNPLYQTEVTTITRAVQISMGDVFAVVSELSPTGDGAIEFVNYTGTAVGNYRTDVGPLTTTITGSTALICEESAGIEIVDITDPALPVLLGTFTEPLGGPRTLVKVGNLAYVANYSAGMTIVDLTNLSSPVTLASVPTGQWCYDVAVVDTYAYAMDYNGNLAMVGVTDPANPNLLTTYYMDAGVRSMAYLNGHLYVGKYNTGMFSGVLTYTLAGTAITLMDIDGIAANVKGITVADGKLFAAASDSGVYIYDLANPDNPAFMGRYQTTGSARMTAVNGNYLFVAAESQGLVVLDITNPANPTLVGTPYTFEGDGAYGVIYNNNKLFVAHWGGGVTALDVTNPAAPVWYGRVNTPGLSYEPFLWDETHLLVNDTYSLEVYELQTVGVTPNQGAQTPATFALHGNYPNPFNATTMISFGLPVSGKVDVAVFDAMGRLVAQPFTGTLPAGEHRISFSAEGLTSGVYFLQVSSPWGEQSGKMVLLK